jgi:hypothetical protein
MAKRIRIDLPNESFFVEIAGEEPTVKEQLRIAELIKSRQDASSPETTQSRAAVQREQLFDTKSGIANAALRAKLSTAENAAEEENYLKGYGLGEGDFLRDNRGRLALTPSGGEKLGISLDKNTLIDEEGFSRYDLTADLAGIVPEIVGGVGGALKGAAVGSAFGPLGTLFGGAVGAGLGAGGGAAVEEAVEGLAGVSEQTAGDIAGDIAREATIGFLGDLTFGTAGLAFRGGKKLLSAKDLPEDELIRLKEAIDMNILPELSTVGAPSLVARQAKIVEKVFGTSSRLKNNYENMIKELESYRTAIGQNAPVRADEAGNLLIGKLVAEDATLKAAEKAARQSVIDTFESAVNQFGAAAEKNLSLNDEVFGLLKSTIDNFDALGTSKFAGIDAVLKDTLGDVKIVPTANLKGLAKTLEDRYAAAIPAALPGEEAFSARTVINSLNALGDNAGFTQLYNARKALNQQKTISRSGSGRQILDDAINAIDSLMTPESLEQFAIANAGKAITDDAMQALKTAGNDLAEARGFYKKGTQLLDSFEDATAIKGIAEAAQQNQIPANVNFLSNIIKPGKPEALKRTLKTVKELHRDGDAAAEQLRSQLAGQWLRGAAQKAIDPADPLKFKGVRFAEEIDGLGSTLDELFGAQANQIRSLAKQIRQTATPNVTPEAIQAAFAEGAEKGLGNALRNVVKLQDEISLTTKNSVFRKIASGDLDAVNAAELISAKKASPNEISQVMSYFRKSGDDEAISKIQSYYLSEMTEDFGGDIFVNAENLKKFAARLNSAAEGGKLRIIYGDEMGKNMEKFGRVLETVSRTAQGGDLVAANIAASPLQNIGKIARFTVVGQFLRSAPYYDQVLRQYAQKISGETTAKQRAVALGQAIRDTLSQIPGQTIDEGVQSAEAQLTAVLENSGLTEQLSQLQQQLPSGPAIASSLSQTPVAAPVAPVAPQQPAATPQQPTIRQRAAASPSVARSLGILGATSDLLPEEELRQAFGVAQ